MEKNRFVLMKIFLTSIFGILLIQGTKSQTVLRLSVNQPSELMVDAGSDATIDVGNNTILGGSPTASGGTGSLTYIWFPPQYVNDETLANPTAQPPGNMTFNITVTDARGCTTTDKILVIVIGGTALGETKENACLEIYPNPTSGLFTLHLEQVGSTDIYIALINVSGKVVYQDVIRNINGFVTSDVDISGLSKGSYFLRINGDFEPIYRQIILK